MKTLLNGVGVAALTILGCLIPNGIPSAQAASYNISMTDAGFVPEYLEVTVGDRVYWWNDDYDFYMPHSTRSYSYPWNSGSVPVGYGVYLDTTKTGSFDYVDDVGYSGTGTLVVKPASPPPGTPVLISASGAVDVVYDGSRDIAYISSGSAILRYQLATDSFLTPFQLSGSLMGLDISPDGNTLVVADSSASSTNVWVHVINLNTGQANRAFFPIAFGESGTFAVAFGGDGAALISSRFAGSGWVPLRRYDPVSGAVTTVASVRQDSMVSSSGDGSTIIIAESDISSGAMDLYDVATRTITKQGGTGHFNYECGASKEGSLFALPTYYGCLVYDRAFNQITNIGVYAGAQPIGAAFHPASDVVFFPFTGTTLVRAYSTATWEILAEYNFQSAFTTPGNHAFTNGRIRMSPDGQIIFATSSGGVRYLRHGLNVPLSHRLVVAGNPGPYGAPTPIAYGTYWLPHGSSVAVSVPAYVQDNGGCVISTGWTGTGSASGSGTTTDTSFTLTSNSILTWNWTPFVVSANPEPQSGGNRMVFSWPSVAGRSYDLLYATNLLSGFVPVATDLPATPPNNTFLSAVPSASVGFYSLKMK